MIPTKAQLISAISTSGLDLNDNQIKKAANFAYILHRENQSQNLTRILGSDEFVSGHLIDVLELFKSNFLGGTVLDIGSGSGVPGLLAASIDLSVDRMWYLTESELSKAEYLKNSAQELKLANVEVYPNRVEDVVVALAPNSIIARAVGTVEKLMSWVSVCSTWNNIVLFKSKGWEKEWSDAQKTRFGKKLTVTHIHEYGVAEKYRVLVNLKRK